METKGGGGGVRPNLKKPIGLFFFVLLFLFFGFVPIGSCVVGVGQSATPE